MSGTVSKRLFLSIVTNEFGSYRKLLTNDLRRAGVEVKVQENFGNFGETTLEKIDDYIQGEGCKVVAILAATFFAGAVGIASTLAILKISLGS